MEYKELDRGRFDSSLVRDGIEVAYTDYDVVKLGIGYHDCDKEAVEDFAAGYELKVVW